MKLDEFVANTLSQIADGIKMAQVTTAETGMRINPTGLSKRTTGEQLFWDERVGLFAERVEFDLAITVTESKTVGGKADISVFGIGRARTGEEQNSNLAVQRVKFSTLVILPTLEEPVGPKPRMTLDELQRTANRK